MLLAARTAAVTRTSRRHRARPRHMVAEGCLITPPPPPAVPTRARFWFRGQKRRNTCLDKPVPARGTYHRTRVAGISQPDPTKHANTKPQASTHPRTQEHMGLQHFDTHTDPASSPHNATNYILYWIGTANDGSQKKTKSAETRGHCVWTSRCSEKRGGGVLCWLHGGSGSRSQVHV